MPFSGQIRIEVPYTANAPGGEFIATASFEGDKGAVIAKSDAQSTRMAAATECIDRLDDDTYMRLQGYDGSDLTKHPILIVAPNIGKAGFPNY